jgi:hypothetical protein
MKTALVVIEIPYGDKPKMAIYEKIKAEFDTQSEPLADIEKLADNVLLIPVNNNSLRLLSWLIASVPPAKLKCRVKYFDEMPEWIEPKA